MFFSFPTAPASPLSTWAAPLLCSLSLSAFTQQTYRFVHNAERAQAVVAQINRAAAETCQQPLIFCTMTDPELRAMIRTSNGVFFDLF